MVIYLHQDGRALTVDIKEEKEKERDRMFNNSVTRKVPCQNCNFDGTCKIQDEFIKIWPAISSSVEDLTFRCLAREHLGGSK